MHTPDGTRNLISTLLSRSSMSLSLVGSHRDEVLRELIRRIPEISGRPEDCARLLSALQEREELHSTGIGDGVALPHARNAVSGLVAEPVIVFGRHAQGIAYGSIDNKPVQLFFLIVTTSVTQHLQILARMSRLLRDANLRRRLLAAIQPSEVLQAVKDAESLQ